jgi:GxxExxY protein
MSNMTNASERLGDSHEPRIIEKELSYEIVGSGFEVYNELGYGFPESVYARALEIVLRSKGFLVEREVHFKVPFRGHIVGQGRMDMLVEKRVIVENKATERLPETTHQQSRSYLTGTKLPLAIILHFGPKFRSHRVLAPWTFSSSSE